MSYSYTLSESVTFTATHAKHMAAKVATDLKRMQRLYGQPSDTRIDQYETEVIELLKVGGLGTVAYGYRRDGNWIQPTLKYTAEDLAGADATDDDPGRVRPGADISGAHFYSYLTYSSEWDRLSPEEKSDVRKRLPFEREGAQEPGVVGYFSQDKTYSSGGRALNRATVVSFT